ncbi:MAG: hypothetical protein IT488_06620 [Gammaproteobacteria bacterium]|nr:hypothetical protein [Gammaproteobacteria bacterium]
MRSLHNVTDNPLPAVEPPRLHGHPATHLHPAHTEFPENRDEISLIDLWLVLMRSKWLLFAGLVFGVGAATLAVFLIPGKSELNTTIEIGSLPADGASVPLESPASIKVKLENSYIPLTQRRFQEKYGESSGKLLAVNVTLPKDSNLIVLESRAPEQDFDGRYVEFHREISRLLVNEHERKLAVQRHRLETDMARARMVLEALREKKGLEVKQLALESKYRQAEADMERLRDPRIFDARRGALENQIQAAKLKSESLKDQEQLLSTRLTQLDTQKGLLESQISRLDSQVRGAGEARLRAVSEVTDESRAMTQLMIDNELRASSDRLASLRERLLVGSPNDVLELNNKIEENKRAQLLQRNEIRESEAQMDQFLREHEISIQEQENRMPELKAQMALLMAEHDHSVREQEYAVKELESQLEYFTDTRVVSEPVRSNRNPGAPSSVILALGAICGLMLGVFAALFAEFLRKAAMARCAAQG